jgi:hypothetical protein
MNCINGRWNVSFLCIVLKKHVVYRHQYRDFQNKHNLEMKKKTLSKNQTTFDFFFPYNCLLKVTV